MADENLTGLKIKDTYEGLLHVGDGGLSPNASTTKRVYDGFGEETVLNLSILNTADPLSGIASVDGTLEVGGELHLDGQMRYGYGTPATGKVLTCSDATGEVVWEEPTGGISSAPSDKEYVSISGTGGATALSQNTTGVYTYQISDLQGVGVDSSKIRGLYIRCKGRASDGGATINATLPDDINTLRPFFQTSEINNIVGHDFIELIRFLPINKYQPSFKLDIISDGVDYIAYEILGAEQFIIGAESGTGDKEYVGLTGGTVNLQQSSTTAEPGINYNVADFTGPGLEVSDIRGIYVRVYGEYLSDSGVTFFSTMPDGSTEEIAQFDGQTSAGTGVGSKLVFIPINKNQSNVTLSTLINNQGSTRTWSWNILGAEQITSGSGTDINAQLSISMAQGRPATTAEMGTAATTGYQYVDLNQPGLLNQGTNTGRGNILARDGVFDPNGGPILIQVAYAHHGDTTNGGAIDQAIARVFKNNVNGDPTKIIVECSNSPKDASGRLNAYFNITAVQHGGPGGGVGSSLIKYGEIDAGNIGVVAPNPVTRGDFTTTVISNSIAGDTHDTTFECVFNTSLANDNYSVMFEIISKGPDINKDNNLKTPVVFNKTAAGFRFNVEEGAVSNVGNNQINVRVESTIPVPAQGISINELFYPTFAKMELNSGSARYGVSKCSGQSVITLPSTSVGDASLAMSVGTFTVAEVNTCMAQNVNGITSGTNKCLVFPANVKVSLVFSGLIDFAGSTTQRRGVASLPCLMNTTGANASPSGALPGYSVFTGSVAPLYVTRSRDGDFSF